MAAIAVLLDSRAALGALRRSLPTGTGGGPVVPSRSPNGLARTLESRLLEAIVLGTRAAQRLELGALRSRFPTIPIVVYGVVRPDDGELLLGWQRLGLAAVAVEKVDDPIVGDLVMRHSASARRRVALADLPRMLRLTEPLQRRAWELLVRGIGRPPRSASLARALGVSREHLSRQFGAGGAPNLKRVADLVTVHAALGLLANPGYRVGTVARLLDFASTSHLGLVVRRVTGMGLDEARGLEEGEVVRRFVRRA